MKKKFIIPVVILILLIVTHPIYLRAIGNFVIINDKIEKADAILVLSGDNPSGDRLKNGIKLLKDKWANKLVLSGNFIAWQTNLADIMEKQALYLGANKENIIKIRHRSDSTSEESKKLLKVFKQFHIKKVIFVTSNYHTKRAKRILNRGFNDEIELLAFPVKDTYFYPDPDNWWKSRIQAKTLLQELTKTVWSYLEK